MSWRDLHEHRDGKRGEAFYLACLEYAQDLWTRGLAARAILCLDRAFGADLQGVEPVVKQWRLPYAALVWILRNVPDEVFIGNPRVHFQHYAGRLSEPRKKIRRARAWACWHIVRAIRPDFPGDAKHVIREPDEGEVKWYLHVYGHPSETYDWTDALINARAS